MTPGEEIREERLRLGLTQKELAARVGNIDHSGVSNIERGETKLGRARAERFARALEISVERLLPANAVPSVQTILNRLQDNEASADRVRAALMAALVAIESRLAGIEEQLRLLAVRERAT